MAAQHHALKQGAAFTGRPCATLGPVGSEMALVGEEGLPADVAGMVAGDHHGPLAAGQPPVPGDHGAAGVEVLSGFAAPVGERPGITGMDQEAVHGRGVGRRPCDLPGADVAAGQPQAVGAEADHHLPGRAELVKAAEHARDRFADRLIRRDDHVVIVVVVQPGGQRQPQLAAGRLGAQSPGHP